jgi:hypothetical protein
MPFPEASLTLAVIFDHPLPLFWRSAQLLPVPSLFHDLGSFEKNKKKKMLVECRVSFSYGFVLINQK